MVYDIVLPTSFLEILGRTRVSGHEMTHAHVGSSWSPFQMGSGKMVAVATSPAPTNVRHWDSSLINDFGRKLNTWSIFGNPQK